MKKSAVAVTFLLVVSGCGGSSDTATPATTVAPAATQASTTTAAVTTTAGPTSTAAPTTTPVTTTAGPTSTAAPTTTATPTTQAPVTTVVSPAELAAVCTFDESVPKISCHAVGATQGSQLRWESNVYGWKTGTSYEFELVEQHQLVSEAIVTLQECQGADCESVTTTIDTSAIAQSPSVTDSGSDAGGAVADGTPTTAVAPDDTDADQAELAAICTFDESVPKISCHAVGATQGSQLRWESNVYGWKTGTSYEFELVEQHQLVSEAIVTLQECQGADCESVTTTIDTSAIAQSPSVTDSGNNSSVSDIPDSPASTTAPTTTVVSDDTAVAPAELAAVCSFDEPQRQLSCHAVGQSRGTQKWTTNLNSEMAFGDTYETTLEWGQFVDEIEVQLEDCNDSECSVASWSTTVVLEARGDCPDDFAGWFTTFPLDDYSQIYEVGPPGRIDPDNHRGHGYFRIPTGMNAVNVHMPVDGTLYAGSKAHLTDDSGLSQLSYGLRFRTPCEGLWIKFGHIIQLSPSVAAVFDELPTQESTVTMSVGPLEMSEGDVMGTAIGFPQTGNAFFDFGVFDDFKRVRTTQDPRFYNAACFYEFFSPMLADYLSSRITRVDNLEPGLCP